MVRLLGEWFLTSGWKMERQTDTIHCSVLPSHSVESANKFVTDLQAAAITVKVRTCGQHRVMLSSPFPCRMTPPSPRRAWLVCTAWWGWYLTSQWSQNSLQSFSMKYTLEFLNSDHVTVHVTSSTHYGRQWKPNLCVTP